MHNSIATKNLVPVRNLSLPGVLLFAGFLLFFSDCDKGLGPLNVQPVDPNAPTGFGGIVYLTNWPSPDSVDLVIQELRIAAFKRAPTDTSGLLFEFLRGNVVIYPAIGTSAFSKRDSSGSLRDSIHYTIYFKPGVDSLPSTYSYIALAWRDGPNVFRDWRPAGLYTTQPGTFNPGSISVEKNRFVPNVDIFCDFRNPPPKPWQ